MKIDPSNTLAVSVSKYYDINTLGKMRRWLTMMSPNAAVFYYEDGKFKHTRVRTLLKSLD